MREIKIGVNALLAILFHQKDLSVVFQSPARAQEGTEGHQVVAARRPEEYRPEVPIEFAFEWEGYRLVVRGRMDGVVESDDAVVVEEIKTTYSALEDLPEGGYATHQAQLRLYLHFVMAGRPGKRASGRLTYLNLESLAERTFPMEIAPAEAEAFFLSLALPFLQAERDRDRWLAARNASLQALEFPFPQRRPGQEELMETVAQAIEEGRDLLAEAATGIGKTIAVLYPALRRLAAGDRYNRLFFLTAKTAGKAILVSTLRHAGEQGLRLRTVFIEARERVCPNPGHECLPEECPFAVDYYAKAGRAIPELLAHELVTPELVQEIAQRDQVCPFELSLDLSLQADLIVGDYNYVFDPRVYLRRFFGPGTRPDCLFLVDEAHNLVPRGREMFSAALSQRDLAALALRLYAVAPELAAGLAQAEAIFDAWLAELHAVGHPSLRLRELPEELRPLLQRLAEKLEELLRRYPPGSLSDELWPFYFTLVGFNRVAELLDDDYALFVREEDGYAALHLFCIHPGRLLRRRLAQGRGAIFFSATLSPFSYFRELLGARSDALTLRLPSPFPQENRLYLHVPGIDTRYKARARSAPALARCVREMVAAHRGNYLVFFPSYAYLNDVRPLIEELLGDEATVILQRPAMSDAQKQRFVKRVTAPAGDRSHVGLAVLGGLFGEAVDLPGEQLVGVLIVGPGLPTVADEQEVIRTYFDQRSGDGALYAYTIPGMIRVIQSAGRVFRTPEDRGVVLLVDDRFTDERTRDLLPPDWFAPGRRFSDREYAARLGEFWGEKG